MCQIVLSSPEDPLWKSALESIDHDIYQMPGYHRLAERLGEGQPYAAICFEADQMLVWPFLLREIETDEIRGARDVTSVYGYPGPVARGCEPTDLFVEESLRGLVRIWKWLGVVSVFTRFNPLLENQKWVEVLSRVLDDECQTPPNPTPSEEGILPCGQTISLDLTIEQEAILRGYDRTIRQAIRAARESGMVTAIDHEWRYLDEFLALYYATMSRNHAASSYFFPRSYFEFLRGELGQHTLFLSSTIGDQLVAASILFECGGIANGHISASDPEFNRISPLKLHYDDVRRLATERGAVAYHLGGGRGGAADSLFAFKTRFSDRRHPYHIGRWVLDRAAYDVLTASRRKRVRRHEDTSLIERYFPAYRAPLLQQQIDLQLVSDESTMSLVNNER